MIDQKVISQIQHALVQEPQIIAAYVLGSVKMERARADSDFDLAMVVKDKMKINYNNIYRLISHISFPKDLDLSIVDKTSSPLFLFQITSTGKYVYQRSEEDRISFESFAMKNYYDTAHIRKIYYSYLKNKFPYANQ